MAKSFINNPAILPATILPQTNPNYHLNVLADNIDAGKQIIKDRQRKIDEANKLAEPYNFNDEEILSSWLPELQGANEEMLNKEVQYAKQGKDWHDPRNIDIYSERKLGYNKLDEDISTARAMTKTFYDAQKLLTTPTTSKEFDMPKSYSRLGEFANAKSYKEAKAVYDKYGGQLLVNNSAVDLSKWDDYFSEMVDAIPAGTRFIDSQQATETANKQIDQVSRVFDDPAIKAQFMSDGGNEEQWQRLTGLYKPQIEAKRYTYKPKQFAPKAPKSNGKPTEEYYLQTDELIRGIQKAEDNAFSGSLVGAQVDDDKVVGVTYRINDKGQKNLVLTLSGTNTVEEPVMEENPDTGKMEQTYSSSNVPQMKKVAKKKEVWINLTDPSNYNKILNYLNTVPGREKISIEELDKMNKKNAGSEKVGLSYGVLDEL